MDEKLFMSITANLMLTSKSKADRIFIGCYSTWCNVCCEIIQCYAKYKWLIFILTEFFICERKREIKKHNRNSDAIEMNKLYNSNHPPTNSF